MPPVNKFRTYGRSNKSIVHNSVDALNLLFLKNKAKTRQNKKKKLLIKPLPARAIGETLLTSDSLHISTEDTFDKLAKGNLCNKVNTRQQKNIKNDSNASKSFKQVNSFYSPIMTRRRKKTASVTELSNYSSRNTSQTEEIKKCDKSNLIIHRLMEPTVDKIDSSLEVERVQKVVPTSLSYIKLPEVREGEVSNNAVRDDISSSKKETSFDPIFTYTFRERHAIHSSTPLIPTKIKERIVNHTISPIKNITLAEGFLNSLRDKFIDTDLSVPKNLSMPLKSVSEDVENSSIKNNSLRSDWKLNAMPKVILTEHIQDIKSFQGFESREEIESRAALNQFSKTINGIQNMSSSEAISEKHSRHSFITLRKRKILKLTYPEEAKKSKRSKKVESSDLIVNKIGDQSNNVTTSLAKFNAFVEKIDSNINLRSNSTHSLHEFESFVAQNKDVINASEYVDSTRQKNEPDGETPINFVTKRRRRMTDSCLMSVKKPKFRKDSRKTDRPKRRYSFQESNCSDCCEVPLKDLIVVIPKYDICSKSNNINANLVSAEYVSCSVPTEESSSRSSSNVFEKLEHSSKDSSNVHTRFQLKNLVVNLTRAQFNTNAGKTNNSEIVKSNLDRSKSLFGESSVNPNKSVINSSGTVAHHVTAEDLVEDAAEENCNSRKHKKSSKTKKLTKGRTKSVAKSKRPLQKEDMVCESGLETSKEIRERNLTKSPAKSTFVQQTSDKSNSSVRDCFCDFSLSNACNEIDPSCASNENVSDVRNTHLSDVIVTENSEFPVDEFENFYVNVTKRSGSSKQPANMKLLPRTLEANKRIKDPENHPKSDLNRNTLTTSSAAEFENFFIRTMEPINSQPEPNNSTVDDVPEEKFEHTDVNLNKLEIKDLIVNITKCSWDCQSTSINTMANEEETERFEHGEAEYLDQRTLTVTKSPSQKNNSNNSRISAALQGTLIDLTSPIKEDYPRKFDVEEPEEVRAETPILINDSSSQEISDIIESSLLESNAVDGDGFRIPSAASILRRRQSKTLVLKAGKLWRRSLSMYRRSSVLLNLMNQETCVLKDGSYCICPRCRVTRESRRMSNRRFSVKIVPASPAYDPQREVSILENYAHTTSYVSDQILEDNLENNLRSLSIRQRNSSIIQNSSPVTARELVLRRCGQTEPILFEECYPGSVLQHCQKIGEGVYGEVFLFRNPNGGTSVMKIIPIEGDLIVNGERQKKFEEIFSEMIIAQELSNLRNNKQSTTSGFSEVQKIQCVQGRYPAKLLDLWDLFDETRGSENDSPEIFGEEQLYIVLQLANGGQDMEAFIFNNAVQAYTMFQQVACALAIAEEELRFEHRDLHWGNVLLSTVDKNKKVNFRLDGKTYEIMTKGVEVAIIDFTLSRIEYDGVVIFNDLSLDPDLFTAEGDYQFEIYKLMQKKNGDNWQRFEPYTNILWLNYTLDKAITALRYKNVQTKIHKEYIGKLKQLKGAILDYSSVKEFVLNNF